MYLRESMTNNEQVAFLVTLGHDEWLEQEQAGQAEENFDDWLGFLGEMAIKLTVPEPRNG